MKTVLIVGRDWKLRALLRSQLREDGYHALGFETLQDAENESAGAAVLLFDTTDATADWRPALQRLAAHLPVLVIASATEDVNIPGVKLLRRPLSVSEIVRAVLELT